MKWAFEISHKLRIASVLAIIMALVIGSNVAVRRNFDNVDKSFTSIYKDRLMPATDFFYITESLYNKRLALEKNLWAEGLSRSELWETIHRHDLVIDSLIRELEKTYLVLNEESLLEELKVTLVKYNSVESEVINLYYAENTSKAISLFENAGVDFFSSLVRELHQLTAIQSVVGKELLNNSHHTIASANMLSFLEVGVALCLVLFVHVILLTSKAIQRKSRQPFHLN